MTSIGVNIAIIRDERVLLTRREDFEVWCLPGGAVDPGESIAQAAVREASEETGLEVELTRMVGIYSRMWNGKLVDNIIALFAASAVDGKLREQEGETIELRYFNARELPSDMIPWHRRRIIDAFSGQCGLVWQQNYHTGFDRILTRQELYDLRDRSGLSRAEFFRRNVADVGEDTLEVGSDGSKRYE